MIDVLDVATAIQCELGAFLIPPPAGLYFRGELTPRLLQGQHYAAVDVRTRQQEPLKGMPTNRQDIYTLDGVCMLKHYEAPYVSTTPNTPIVGTYIVKALVDSLVDIHGVWARPPEIKKVIVGDFDEIAVPVWELPKRSYLDGTFDQYLIQPELMDPDIKSQTILEEIYRITSPLAREVKRFLGEHEEDRWMMHEVRQHASTLLISKDQDFRVYDWKRKMESGEWTRLTK